LTRAAALVVVRVVRGVGVGSSDTETGAVAGAVADAVSGAVSGAVAGAVSVSVPAADSSASSRSSRADRKETTVSLSVRLDAFRSCSTSRNASPTSFVSATSRVKSAVSVAHDAGAMNGASDHSSRGTDKRLG
jgi:hypothetical protein